MGISELLLAAPTSRLIMWAVLASYYSTSQLHGYLGKPSLAWLRRGVTGRRHTCHHGFYMGVLGSIFLTPVGGALRNGLREPQYSGEAI